MLLLLIWTNERLTSRLPKQILIIKVPMVIRLIDTLHATVWSNMRTMGVGSYASKNKMDGTAGNVIAPDFVVVAEGFGCHGRDTGWYAFRDVSNLAWVEKR